MIVWFVGDEEEFVFVDDVLIENFMVYDDVVIELVNDVLIFFEVLVVNVYIFDE